MVVTAVGFVPLEDFYIDWVNLSKVLSILNARTPVGLRGYQMYEFNVFYVLVL